MNSRDRLIAFLEEYAKEVKNIGYIKHGEHNYPRNNNVSKLQRLRIAVNQLGIEIEKGKGE
jgi:mRNA-degrading endonuclease RelE of RelBE toxin-antitoxin system